MDTTSQEPGNTAKHAKIFAILVLATTTSIVRADGGKTVYQTLPNSTIRDYRAPAYITKGNTTYQTMPRSNIRDYSAPAYVSKGKK